MRGQPDASVATSTFCPNPRNSSIGARPCQLRTMTIPAFAAGAPVITSTGLDHADGAKTRIAGAALGIAMTPKSPMAPVYVSITRWVPSVRDTVFTQSEVPLPAGCSRTRRSPVLARQRIERWVIPIGMATAGTGSAAPVAEGFALGAQGWAVAGSVYHARHSPRK